MKILTLLFIMFAFEAAADTCKCSARKNIVELAKNADLVFEGIPVSVESIYNFTDIGVNLQDLIIADKYRVEVSKIHKGETASSTVIVYIKAPFPSRSNSCKLSLTLNKRVIVFATNQSFFPKTSKSYLEVEQIRAEETAVNEVYYTNKCSGTTFFKKSHTRELVTIK